VVWEAPLRLRRAGGRPQDKGLTVEAATLVLAVFGVGCMVGGIGGGVLGQRLYNRRKCGGPTEGRGGGEQSCGGPNEGGGRLGEEEEGGTHMGDNRGGKRGGGRKA